jgi:hypothetical protein
VIYDVGKYNAGMPMPKKSLVWQKLTFKTVVSFSTLGLLARLLKYAKGKYFSIVFTPFLDRLSQPSLVNFRG